MLPRELLKKFINILLTTLNLNKTLINELVSNRAQMKGVLHISMGITNNVDP